MHIYICIDHSLNISLKDLYRSERERETNLTLHPSKRLGPYVVRNFIGGDGAFVCTKLIYSFT